MQLDLSLSMEQQFQLKAYAQELENMDSDAKNQIILSLAHQVFTHKNINKQLIKQIGELELGGIQAAAKRLNK